MKEQTSSMVGPSDRVFVVKKTSESLRLDGKGEDSLWQEANVLQDFVLPWQERTPPRTAFSALYTEEFLFFKFEVEDSALVLWEDSSQNLAVIGSDRVELFFAANDTLNPYFQLEMDPRTWVFDAKSFLYREVDAQWNWEGMQTFSTISENGYILEGRIPLQSFDRFGLWQDKAKTQLLCGVFRAEFVPITPDSIQHNWISWIVPQSTSPDFHIPSAFGRLHFEP